jgi:DNA (cytosine-5)-methyltransferase 1
VLLENVSGMKSSGNFAQRIERELTMALGARVSSRLLNAEEYGVPQKRRRLVFVGIKNSIFDFESITKTHGPDIGKQFNTVRDAIGDLPSLTSNSEATRYLQPPQSEYQTLMRRGVRGNVLTNHRAPNHPQDTIARIANTPEGAPMYPAFKQRIRLSWNLPSPTQVSGGIRPQFQFGHPSDARGLTIRERCRLQSFPDHFQVTGGIVQGRVQTGNAVPPLLARAVAISIRKYLDHL